MLSHAGWIKSFFETWKGMLWKSGAVTHTCNPSSQWAEAENFTTTWRPGWSTWELLKEFVFHLLIYSESLCWTHCLCGGQRTTPGVSSLPPPCGFQNINSALQGCWQVPLYWANSVIDQGNLWITVNNVGGTEKSGYYTPVPKAEDANFSTLKCPFSLVP